MSKPSLFSPKIFNTFKPTSITSYDVIRHFKRNLPEGFGKIGHFGTLDPFASGILMIGTGGAARLNDLIHDYLPKTYLAIGKLGIETPTGDHTSEIIQKDDSLYFKNQIKDFSSEFIEMKIREKFLGEYLQAPHKYSASKFMGKNLHEWAREGVEVKKEKVPRRIYDLKVVKYKFPYLSIEAKVSSGTYIRTLFSDISEYLGTLGSLIGLVRTQIGEIQFRSSLRKKDWPSQKDPKFMDLGMKVDNVLPFKKFICRDEEAKKFKNGAFLKESELRIFSESKIESSFGWMIDEKHHLLGLCEKYSDELLKPKINFSEQDF